MKCALCQFLPRFFVKPLFGELLFNADISIEIDRLIAENEKLREQIAADSAS